MPELSRFYGIVIQMYSGDHPPPHYHALYPCRGAASFNSIVAATVPVCRAF